jgi:hypothetical protein
MLQMFKTEDQPINNVSTKVRRYKNTLTGNELSTYLLKTDKSGNQWWSFVNLFELPFVRQLAAKKVLDLYGHGLSLEDVKTITGALKATLRSDSPEKYDLAMAKVLELEGLTETMSDPVKQCMGLCTVYLLLNDEQPDAYLQSYTNQKMTFMALDADLQAFFLRWWTEVMRSSGQVLSGFSRIVSGMASLPVATDTGVASG